MMQQQALGGPALSGSARSRALGLPSTHTGRTIPGATHHPEGRAGGCHQQGRSAGPDTQQTQQQSRAAPNNMCGHCLRT